MSELELRCNNLKCRSGLSSSGKACVTTCSHIFCYDCANKCFSSALVCPACDSPLPAQEDIIMVDLNPSEEFKSSVLAGLKPETIIEISSRALSFYMYQLTQESVFQQMLYKNLDEKHAQLNKQHATLMLQAEQEIEAVRDKLLLCQRDAEKDKKKLQEIHEQFQEKSRQLQKLQQLYDKLKRKQIAGTLQQDTPYDAEQENIRPHVQQPQMHHRQQVYESQRVPSRTPVNAKFAQMGSTPFNQSKPQPGYTTNCTPRQAQSFTGHQTVVRRQTTQETSSFFQAFRPSDQPKNLNSRQTSGAVNPILGHQNLFYK